MKLGYTIEYSRSLIRVRTSGVFDYLAALEVWKKIVMSCEANNCFNVLGVSMLSEPIPQLDAYDYLNLLESAGISPKYRIAWVAGREELLENMRIVETIFRNRSQLDLRVFEALDEAREWLAVNKKPQ